MNDHSTKALAVHRPIDVSPVRSDRLLIISDDSVPEQASNDSMRLIMEISRKHDRAIQVMRLSENLNVRWLRLIWSRMVEYGSIHILLTRSALLSPSVLALLIVARFFGRSASVVISGPAADLDGDTLRRHSFVLRLIDNLAVQSPHLLERLRRHEVKCRLVPPVIGNRWYLNKIVTRVQPVIMWAGECDEQSHLSVAFKAYQTVKQKYPRAELIVVCPDANSASLPQEVDRKAGLHRVDSTDTDAVIKAYANADVFLNTSIVDSQPIALMRALAAGLPVVSVAVGSLKHLLVNGQSALLLPLDSHTRFADSIIDLVESDDLTSRLSAGARKIAGDYRLDRTPASWCTFLGLGS